MQFVIVHGAFGSSEGNWFPQLKENLEGLGQEVIVPQFPVDDWDEVIKGNLKANQLKQSLNSWLTTFEREVLPKLKKEEKLTMIGHSLGPVFILHAVIRFGLTLDCGIFVIPFLRSLKTTEVSSFDLVNASFYKQDFDWKDIKKRIPTSYVLYSESDPYVSKEYPQEFAKLLGSSVIQVQGAGHLNAEVNLNEFPLVYELCKTRLNLSLYQQYLAHRRDLFAVDYLKGKTEEKVYIQPHEIFDEGVFHFRNLKKYGFCTLLTGPEFWDTQTPYMKECRKAAKRVKNLTRVYIVESAENLKRPKLLEQMQLDLDSGIQVFLCWKSDVAELPELDFGIWDNDYVCCVRFKGSKDVQEVELSSRKSDIELAREWEEAILKRSVRVHNVSADVQAFVKSRMQK